MIEDLRPIKNEKIIGRGTWYDKAAEELIKREKKLNRKLDKIRTESGLGASGYPHIGSLADSLRNYAIALALELQGYNSEYIAFADDKDGLRKVPEGMPNELEQYLGYSVAQIPDIFGNCHISFGEHMSSLLKEALEEETQRILEIIRDHSGKSIESYSRLWNGAIKTGLNPKGFISDLNSELFFMPIFPPPLEDQPYRRPRESVCLSENSFDVPEIAVLDVFRAVCKDHEGWGVGTRLGGIIEFQAPTPYQVGLVPFYGLFQRIVDLPCCEFFACFPENLIHRFKDPLDPEPCEAGNGYDRHIREEKQFLPDMFYRFIKGPVILLNEVPFIEADDEASAPLVNKPCDAQILVYQTFRAVHKEQAHVAAFNCA